MKPAHTQHLQYCWWTKKKQQQNNKDEKKRNTDSKRRAKTLMSSMTIFLLTEGETWKNAKKLRYGV